MSHSGNLLCTLNGRDEPTVPALLFTTTHSDSDYRTRRVSMHRFLWAVLLAVFSVVSVPLTTVAQSNQLINTRDWYYELIERLQTRGYLLSLNPTDLPYTTGAVRTALQQADTTALGPRERQWYRQLAGALADREPNVGEIRAGGIFTGGLRGSSTDRLNVLEPRGDGDPTLHRAQFTPYLEWGPWIAQAGATVDRFYEADPDGISTAGRFDVRSEEAYVGYNSTYVDVYLGRFDNHWALHDRRGGLLTDNPRSFDQLQFQLGNSTLSFQSILGVLDNMSPDSTFTGQAFGEGVTRRFVSLHRLDWSPSSSLKLSLMEGEIYHSPTASISLRNFIPLHAFFFESTNKPRLNDSNIIVGGSVWTQVGPVTVHVQSMLDDILISRREVRKRSGEFYPAIYTVNGSATWAGVTDQLDLGTEVDVVSANSFRTDNRADEWSYAQRGLATNLSDYVRVQGHATWYPMSSLEVEPALTWYRNGEGDFRRVRITYAPGPGGAIPSVLTGTVEQTIRPSVSVRYQPLSFGLFDDNQDVRFSAWIDANVGVNFTENADHVQGATRQEFVGLFRIFGQISF